MRLLLAGAALCAGLNGAQLAFRPGPAKPRAAPKLSAESALQTAALMSLGMRRLAADLELIRLFVYYGTPEAGHEDHEHQEHQGEAPFDPAHPERSWGGGRFPEVGPRARRIIEIDPTFSYAVLYAAGALAFNLNRAQEALDLLQEALDREPKNTQYRVYLAAIGVSRTGDPRRAAELLEPALADPDCPTMVKSTAAFMHRRLGNKRRAAEIYLDILEHSKDPGYRDIARRGLAALGLSPHGTEGRP